ncbi:MAG: protein kinase [Candidatus Methanomethyliaceae archaeon]
MNGRTPGVNDKVILERIDEIKLYRDQGLHDIAEKFVRELIELVEKNSNIDDDSRTNFLLIIEDEFREYLPEKSSSPIIESNGAIPSSSELTSINSFVENDPKELFYYARNLMTIHNWDEAINIFKFVAATGYQVEECYEACGDCAYRAGRYQEALEYYQIVYNLPDLPEEIKKRVFDKITKCRQKKLTNKLGLKKGIRPESAEKESSLLLVSHVDNLSQYVGAILRSWKWEKELPWTPVFHDYELGELVQIGNTWALFEASRLNDGKSFAAITLTPSWWKCIKRESFVNWFYINSVMDSEYLVIPDDLAVAQDGTFFVICSHYDYSLSDYMTDKSDRTDLDEALVIGYQILEGLGYLHLHLAKDKHKRKIYHLDLRPSRIFFSSRGKVKIGWGGLWQMFANLCPHLTNYRVLPLSFLFYKAPEQFRPYLWSSKKPLVCTDIYQFGVVFYEMITGLNPFMSESAEEVEMLHCDQKPIPPQVIRPDLPEELSELIMNCLHPFPAKRWRSTTQILLAIEKMLGGTAQIRQIMVRKKEAIHGKKQNEL